MFCARDVTELSRLQQVHKQLEMLATAPERAAWAERDECIICMNAQRTARLLPCHHVLMCSDCAAATVQSGRKCPLCGGDADRYETGQFFETYSPQ